MINEFIPYEEALALRELGFDEKCLGIYYNTEDGVVYSDPTLKLLIGGKANENNEWEVNAILYQQAFRWFREEHGLVKQDYLLFQKNVRNAFIISKDDGENLYDSCYNSNDEEVGDGFSTYEEAEFACLRKLIETVNQNKNE